MPTTTPEVPNRAVAPRPRTRAFNTRRGTGVIRFAFWPTAVLLWGERDAQEALTILAASGSVGGDGCQGRLRLYRAGFLSP